MLKKMLLLASMALAAIAFAAPAAQASLDWSEEGAIHGSGELTSVSATGLETGPAVVEFTGAVGGTEGVITDFTINAPVQTNVESCEAVAAINSAEGEGEWVVHLATPDTMIITDATFRNQYEGTGCASAGVPTFVPVTGDVTLTVEEDGETGEGNCADADPYNDGMLIEHPSLIIPVDITGTVCWEGPSITGL